MPLPSGVLTWHLLEVVLPGQGPGCVGWAGLGACCSAALYTGRADPVCVYLLSGGMDLADPPCLCGCGYVRVRGSVWNSLIKTCAIRARLGWGLRPGSGQPHLEVK